MFCCAGVAQESDSQGDPPHDGTHASEQGVRLGIG